MDHPKRKRSYSKFQPSIFRCELLVSGKVGFKVTQEIHKNHKSNFSTSQEMLQSDRFDLWIVGESFGLDPSILSQYLGQYHRLDAWKILYPVYCCKWQQARKKKNIYIYIYIVLQKMHTKRLWTLESGWSQVQSWTGYNHLTLACGRTSQTISNKGCTSRTCLKGLMSGRMAKQVSSKRFTCRNCTKTN